MTHQEIETRLKSLLCEILVVKPDAISRSSRFDADLGADPLDCVELIMTCEDEWDIHITEDEAESAYTFGKLADLIDDKINGKACGHKPEDGERCALPNESSPDDNRKGHLQ